MHAAVWGTPNLDTSGLEYTWKHYLGDNFFSVVNVCQANCNRVKLKHIDVDIEIIFPELSAILGSMFLARVN